MPVVEGFQPLICGDDPANHRPAGACSARGMPRPTRASPTTPPPHGAGHGGTRWDAVTRMVLLKDYDADGFVFYTNYESRKGMPVAGPCRGCTSVSLEVGTPAGPAGRADQPDDSGRGRCLFSSVRGAARSAPGPRSSHGRWKAVSPSKSGWPRSRARHVVGKVPRPPHWSGFRLQPTLIEFWQDGAFRLHDRPGIPARFGGRAMDHAHPLSLKPRWRWNPSG